MRRVLRVFAVLAIVISAPLSNACGDKLLVLGRALRFSNIASQRPAAILAYAPQGSLVSTIVREPQWVAAMDKGKHRVTVIQELDGIATALRSNHYDLLLASASDAVSLKQRIQAASSALIIVPVLPSSPARDELRAVEKEYGVALRTESQGKFYVSTVSKAVELRDRHAQYLAQTHKSGPLS